jgi:CheY-like chemotaxis protein
MSSSQNESLNNKEYSVVELVNRLKSATEAKIGAKKVSFEVNVSNTVSSKLVGDINKVQKILLNVLNNAAKFTDIGKIKLDIGASKEKNIQTLNFVILDTGCGIKDDDQEHIYEDGSDDKKGVGLAISKSYVESMGGTISFKSVYGAGTTFYISIPQIISGNRLYVDDVVIVNDEDENEIIDCSKYKIAIVDDDSLDIKVTLKLLKKYNFNIEVIKSTVDFINKIKCEEKYDLVFLDHKMPVFDGIKTLKALKQLESYELPKFICFTANSVSGAREFYLSNGFDEYLSKPIDIKELNRIIRKFCKK